MTPMMETAARALFDAWVRRSAVREYAAEPYWLAYKDHYAELVRAALEAIREPDDAMLRSGMAEGWCDADMAQTTHRAMIDAILNEKTP